MQELFPPLPHSIREALQDFPKVLNSVLPMQAKHRHQLPYAIEELSTRLTSERGLLQQPYWSAPRFTSAYVWYFLPWNIIRLARLLNGLSLPEPTPLPVKKGGEPVPRIFVDMGSGPLSLPIALWLAKPQWRHIPLTLLCTDISPHPLMTGQKIFEALAGKDSPWRVVTRRCHLEGTAVEIHKTEGIPWLITAANVCNELKGKHEQSTGERLEELLGKLLGTLNAPDARLLFVEPGTRLGGKTIVSLREAAQSFDLVPESPCTHGHACPLDETRTWCHFTFDIQGAPRWLTELSAQANLRKDALSLAFVLLQKERYLDEQEGAEGQSSTMQDRARIISAPFRVPHLPGFSRYACAPQGLTLLGRAQSLSSGALVSIHPPTEDSEVDKKSGAFVTEHREHVPSYDADREYSSHNRGYARQDYRDAPPSSSASWGERGNSYSQQRRSTQSEGYSDERYSSERSSGRPSAQPERKKKVHKPSKRNEKKFWEK